MTATDLVDPWMEFDQRLYAAKTGDAFKVIRESHGDLWWFVKTVNGPEKTITAQTVIFGQFREQIFPFNLCSPVEADSREREIEANEAREQLGMELREWDEGLEPVEIAVDSLPARYRDLVAPLPAVCHGYSNGCNCLRCGYPAMTMAA